MKNELKVRTRTPSSYELNVLLPILKKGLEIKKGRTNAVTKKQIMLSIKKHGLKINNTGLSSLLAHIRENDLIVGLMASPDGYYITSNVQELMKYEDNILRRETALRKLRMSIKRQRTALFLKKNEQPLNKVGQLF